MKLVNAMTDNGELDRKRRIRRNALLLGLVALAFYVAFIVMSITGR